MLTALHKTCSHWNNLNPATLLPCYLVTYESPHKCSALTDHLLTPLDGLQETPLSTSNFSRFTDGPYLKGYKGQYCTEYAISTPFDVTEVTPLPLATTALQAELYPLTRPYTPAKGKTFNIYNNSRYAFRIAHDLGTMSLFPVEINFKMVNTFRNYWM